MKGLIFDLDQTIIDSSIAQSYRDHGKWQDAKNLVPQFNTYSGIIEAMQFFKMNGLKICIVTSSPSNYCEHVLKVWKIPFDFKVCYHDTGRRKPHPDPIIRALTLMSSKPEDVFSFGDKDIDILASNSANVTSVACLWGASDLQSLNSAKPNHVINNSIELLTLVNDYLHIIK